MKKTSVNTEGLCPVCSKNLALVGRAHPCRPMNAAIDGKPSPKPKKLTARHLGGAVDEVAKKAKADEVFDEDGRFIDKETDRLMQGALQSTRAKGETEYPSHPDCARCNRNRELARERARERRAE